MGLPTGLQEVDGFVALGLMVITYIVLSTVGMGKSSSVYAQGLGLASFCLCVWWAVRARRRQKLEVRLTA